MGSYYGMWVGLKGALFPFGAQDAVIGRISSDGRGIAHHDV